MRARSVAVAGLLGLLGAAGGERQGGRQQGGASRVRFTWRFLRFEVGMGAGGGLGRGVGWRPRR